MGSKRNAVKRAVANVASTLSPPASPPNPDDQDDDGLLDDLLAQLDGKSEASRREAATVLKEVQINSTSEASSVSPPPKKKDARSRHEARQARKAAAVVANCAPNDEEADALRQQEKEAEEASIRATCDRLGLELYEINPDGHCLYSAIADQLALLSIIPPQMASYQTTRHAAAAYMLSHRDDFLAFLPSLDGEDGIGATEETGLMSPANYARYCSIVRDTGAWGGEPEITALAKAYNVPIHVVQSGPPPVVVHEPAGGVDPRLRPVLISYHRHMFGLGEHYNSLRPRRVPGAL